MLPNSVIIIPRYVLFNKFGWVDSYMPFWVPALLACYPFFIYQLIQFMRGIPAIWTNPPALMAVAASASSGRSCCR